MSSALSYYAAKNRASTRLDNKKNEISRSSAYMIDTGGSYGKTSYTPSYDTLKRESSFTADSGRAGRARYRDHSVDYSTRPSHRSSSIELSTTVKLRTRDISVDTGSSRRDYTNGISSTNSYTPSSRAPRPKTTNFEDERSEEYKRIMSNTDKYLTMNKYLKADKETAEVNGMVEEERRSKSYAKIINQQSAASLETDCARETLNDIFMNTSGFSAKSVQAITKEMLYKEEKGPKNYGWRKDMENYEDNLEKTAQHKRNVRESTKATRDVGFKDTDSKIRNYDRECRRNVDTPKPNGIVINTKPLTQTTSYSSTVERKNNDQSNYRTAAVATSRSDSTADGNTETKKGSWCKDLEKFEDKITKKRQDSDTKIDTTRNISSSTVESQPKTYSWQKPSSAEIVKPVEVKAVEPVKHVPASKKTEIVPKPAEPQIHATSLKKLETANKIVPMATKPQKPAEPEKSVPKWAKTDTVKTKIKASKHVEIEKNKAEALGDKPKPLESKDPEIPVPKCKKPDLVKEEPKPSEAKTTEPEKTVPKWNKQSTTKKEEPKPVEPEKPVPKWKKPAVAKKEEPKPTETKPTEPEKPVPKWKKPEQAKKEEPKPAETKTAEPENPVPKWEKTAATKQEEPKAVEPEKPVPKWKKQVTTKKEEPNPTEPEKPVPKWKKPEAAKVEETTPAEPAKPAPKWKKPVPTKNEEPKEYTESSPTISVSEPVKEQEPETKTKPVSNTANETSPANPDSEAVVKAEEEKKKEEEEAEEEDVTGMRAMRKEQASKFSDMDAEFAAGASKLSALRAKMKALRMKHKASAEADAATNESRKG